MKMNQEQFDRIKAQAQRLAHLDTSLYHAKFQGLDLAGMRDQADFETLPFTDKADLRQAYPLGLAAVPMEQVVRLHSSSGTTGTPVIIPYTKRDVEDWAIQFARCYTIAGCTAADRIQITPGYGLWTAGIGFQAGAELLGAMAIPMGPGNTEKQLAFMRDMGTMLDAGDDALAKWMEENADLPEFAPPLDNEGDSAQIQNKVSEFGDGISDLLQRLEKTLQNIAKDRK